MEDVEKVCDACGGRVYARRRPAFGRGWLTVWLHRGTSREECEKPEPVREAS